MSTPLSLLPLFAGSLNVMLSDTGTGPVTYLLLHGGAGPGSVAGLGQRLAAQARVVAPILPGFHGTVRPEWLASVGDLALMCLALIDRMGLTNVVLVGNSIGGWLAADVALRNAPAVKGAVLINAAGVQPEPGQPAIVNPLHVPPQDRAKMAFHDPATFAPPPSAEALAMMQANQAPLMAYGGQPFMYDPDLRARLAGMTLPVHVLWGTSDQIVTLDYGRSLAASIPGAAFQPIEKAGHFPQIEQSDQVVQAITHFAGKVVRGPAI